MNVQTVRVGLGARAYDVLIGAGLIGQAGDLIAARGLGRRVAIVTDGNVAPHYVDQLADGLRTGGIEIRGSVIVPPGERAKCWAEVERVCDELLGLGLERADVLIALGGGVVGDLAGFAAAVVRRGIAFVQVPTTLLAQVDSSVGGKTGINTPRGKNLIGAFHQPALVLADVSSLATLPEREVRAGYAEVVKYGLLGDAAFYRWLDDNREGVLSREPASIVHAVTRSVEMKSDIVARDERETGDRALLNLGHTFGHALEAWAGYSDRLLHGEAVAIGMCQAFRFSEQLGLVAPQTAAQVASHIKSVGLPTRIDDIQGDTTPTIDEIIALMRQDKKVVDGELTLVLARAIGSAFVTRAYGVDAVASFLADEVATDP